MTDGVAPIHGSDFDGDNFDNLYYNKAGSKLLGKWEFSCPDGWELKGRRI